MTYLHSILLTHQSELLQQVESKNSQFTSFLVSYLCNEVKVQAARSRQSLSRQGYEYICKAYQEKKCLLFVF